MTASLLRLTGLLLALSLLGILSARTVGGLLRADVLVYSARHNTGESADNATYDLYLLDVSRQLVRRLTSTPSNATQPDWSPGGRSIAFSALLVDGNMEIGEVAADGRHLRLLTRSDIYETTPSYSPDGQQIAYVADSWRRSVPDLHIMSATNATWQRLLQRDSLDAAPRWSPDGTRLIFAAMDTTPYMQRIYSVRRDGSDLIALTGTGADDAYTDEPDISPDGRRIVYVRDESELWLINVDGSDPRRLTRHSDTCALDSPRWSPDGTRIAYIALCGYDLTYLALIDLRDGTPQRVAPQMLRLLRVPVSGLDWQP